MHILGLPTDIFNVYPASVKFKTYQARWQIGDIYVSGDARKTEDNPQGLGCYLVMTGRGCDDIYNPGEKNDELQLRGNFLVRLFAFFTFDVILH